MVPVPEFDDFEVFNEQLAEDLPAGSPAASCAGKADIKAELLEEDRRAMLPLPRNPFEARRVEPCQANSLSLVRFDRNDYSVPTQYAHQAVMAIGGIEKVRFVVQDQVVAEHPRDWDKENVHYDPVHYLALLERKPGALDFGKPFDDWDLPEGFGVLRRRLEGELGQDGPPRVHQGAAALGIVRTGGTGPGGGSCACDRGLDRRGRSGSCCKTAAKSRRSTFAWTAGRICKAMSSAAQLGSLQHLATGGLLPCKTKTITRGDLP